MKSLRKLPKAKLQQLILVGIVTAIGVSAMAVFWINNELTKLSEAKATIEKLGQETQQLEVKTKQEAQDRPQLERLESFVEKLRPTMVTGDAFSWTVREISLWAEQHPVRLLSIRPGVKGPHPRSGGYEVYGASIEVEGTYDQLGMFIKDFENRFPVGEVRLLELGASEGEGVKRRATLQLLFLVCPELKMGVKDKEEPKKSS